MEMIYKPYLVLANSSHNGDDSKILRIDFLFFLRRRVIGEEEEWEVKEEKRMFVGTWRL